jgi:hypothetical protein
MFTDKEKLALVVSLMVAALAVGGAECPTKVKGVACYHTTHFHCPPNMKRTPQGCWDGHRLFAYRYTTKRTTSAIIGIVHERP